MFFDEIANEWDNNRRIERARVLANSICEKLGRTQELIALEIGCGTGLITFELNNRFHEIHCIDTSNEMLAILNDKIEKSNTRNIITYSRELFYDQNFLRKFDIIYSSMVFHHIVDIEVELHNYSLLLKEGGILIIIDLDKEDGRFHMDEKDFCGHNGFQRDKLQKSIEKCMFEDVNFTTVYQGEKIINNEIINYSLFLCQGKC